MRNLRPIQILLAGSFVVFTISLLTLVLVEPLFDLSFTWIFVAPLLSSIGAYVVFYLFIKKFITEKLKVLYRSIRKGKFESQAPETLSLSDDLIEIWSPDLKFEGLHDTEIDVTGGIGLKAARGAEVAKLGIEVVIVNGSYPKRVFDACLGKEVLGTKIIA